MTSKTKWWGVVKKDAPKKVLTVHRLKKDAVSDLCGKHEKVVRVAVRVA